MGNINIENIWTRGFEDKDLLKVEEYCRKKTSIETDKLLDEYMKLVQSYNGKYISSDLMKMIFPFYANNIENRRKYNLAVSNSASCLANELYKRQVSKPGVKHCIFVAGSYGAGKSFFIQSLYEKNKSELEDCIVYEGSITTKSIDGKIECAIENGVIPNLIVLNPTLDLTLHNIVERAARIGRNVRKEDAVFVYANIYQAVKRLKEKYNIINYVIYNKKTNIPEDFTVSIDVEDLNHGSYEEISNEYDKIMKGVV